MPLKQSASADALHDNIRELVKSGRKIKQAVAIGLSHQRKMKKMAQGGMIESQMDSDDGDSQKPGEATYPMGDDEQGLSPNVMSAQALAEGLQAARYKANDNSVSYEADDEVAGKKMADGGLIDEASPLHAELGSKPSQDMMDGSEEPMSSQEKSMGSNGPLEHSREVMSGAGLSKEAIEAIKKKRASRKFG